MDKKVLVERVDHYIVTFIIEGNYITVQVHDTKSGETLDGGAHLIEDPRKFEEDAEMRKRFAKTAVEILEFFQELRILIENRSR